MGYSRTQLAPSWFRRMFVGYLVIVVALTAILGGGPVMTMLLVGLLVVVAIVSVVFTRLTVKVEETTLTASFGWGWPRKVIDLSRVRLATRVRNRWWYGWGIRLTPVGWLWNVWGLDAIELELQSGKAIRIGTSDPDGLLRAVGTVVPTP